MTGNNGLKDTTKKLLEAVGIKRVVYVDDLFGITPERIQLLCDELEMDQIKALEVFDQDINNIKDKTLFHKKIAERIDGLSTDERYDAFPILNKHNDTSSEAISEDDRKGVSGFVKVFPVGLQTSLSFTDWQTRKDILISEAKETKTLFVFDDNLSMEGGNKDEGTRCIESICAQLSDGAEPYYALFTHKVQNENGEESLLASITKEHPNLKDNLVVIAKTSLTEEPEWFSRKLKLTILLDKFREITETIKIAISEANINVLKEVDALDIETFESVVFHSSEIEGAWAVDTLLRIYGTINEKLIFPALRGETKIHNLINETNAICGVTTAESSDNVKASATELQRKDMYDDSEYINKLHLPVECGDIFKGTRGKNFVLIEQPCSLVVRSKGFRRDEKTDDRLYVTLAEIEEEKVEDEIITYEPHMFGLEFFNINPELRSFVKLNKTIVVPAWTLDLSVLNGNGECRIDLKHTLPEILIPPWQNRVSILYKRARSIIEDYRVLNIGKQGDKERLLQLLSGLPLNSPVKVGVDDSGKDDWKLEFTLQRTNRLRGIYAVELLSKFSVWNARIALPHDLTRGS